jgi:hypothetical protein
MDATYVIPTRIARIEAKRRILRGRIVNGDAVFDHEDLGWFVSFAGIQESFCLGLEPPRLTVGQQVNLRIEPREIQD